MTTTPIADFTAGEVKMVVRRGSYTPIVITFNDLDLTGYTSPQFLYGSDESVDASTLSVSMTPGADTAFALTLDSTDWTALASISLARFELAVTTPGGQPMSLLTGDLSIEDSFL